MYFLVGKFRLHAQLMVINGVSPQPEDPLQTEMPLCVSRLGCSAASWDFASGNPSRLVLFNSDESHLPHRGACS